MASVTRGALARAVETTIQERVGRECLFMPSGRMALYLALRTLLSPGDRLLMSPVTDDVVFFTVLAAGLRPVMAPLSPRDGNIDPSQIEDATWSNLNGVMTTNLYGLPDPIPELGSRCRDLGIPLIEDAAHALETELEGQLVGSFGAAAAFSFSKHLQAGGGGVLAIADAGRRPELERARGNLTLQRHLDRRILDLAIRQGYRLVFGLHLVRPVRHARRALGLVERRGFRMPLRGGALAGALAAAPSLERFDTWVRVDMHDYRMVQSPPLLRRVLDGLRHLEGDRARRLAAVARARELAVAAPEVRQGPVQALFRIPLLIENRADVIAHLERHGIGVGYIFDPPLDDYGGGALAELSPHPEVARWWASRVLPVNPLDAHRVLRVLEGIDLLPATFNLTDRREGGTRWAAPPPAR